MAIAWEHVMQQSVCATSLFVIQFECTLLPVVNLPCVPMHGSPTSGMLVVHNHKHATTVALQRLAAQETPV